MILPNKTITIKESSLYKAALLIPKISNHMTVVDLYESNRKLFFDIPEFIDALDILFASGRIELDDGVLKIA